MTISNIIAIDGPSGSGKSTVSKILANRLSFLYIDTGAMYRAITYKILENDLSKGSEEDILCLLKNTSFEYIDSALYMDGKKLGDEIRTPQIDMNVSWVSAKEIVRSFLATQQIRIGTENASVIDGRDIGTVLFPDAVLKIFLTADVHARAERRYRENCKKGIKSCSLEEIIQQIRDRDSRDSSREIAPLKKAQDAIEIDTGDMTIEEVVNTIENLYNQRVSKLCTMY